MKQGNSISSPVLSREKKKNYEKKKKEGEGDVMLFFLLFDN